MLQKVNKVVHKTHHKFRYLVNVFYYIICTLKSQIFPKLTGIIFNTNIYNTAWGKGLVL